jgi:gamma-glutamylputrescine oxidase
MLAAMTFNGGLGFETSYYLATAKAAPRRPALAGDMEADIAILGGGCTGLSAALHAAKAGLKVVLLEGGRIGWGASGRNGGQIIPGLRQGAAQLEARLGPAGAKALLSLAFEARDLVVELIGEYAMNCDLRTTGHLHAAVRPGDFARMAADALVQARMFPERPLEVLPSDPRGPLASPSRDRMATLAGPSYAGGVFDPAGGHFHPLNYALGLAQAAAGAGAALHEESLVTGIERTGDGARLITAAGSVEARTALICGDALLAGLLPAAEHRIMPVASYIAVTEPLDFADELIPSNAAVSDSRFVVNYYRRTADDRLLFGGGERYSRRPPADIAAFVRPHIEATFPRLKGVALTHAWGGLVSVTMSRLPHFARDGNLLIAHGYSGMGAVLSTLAGKLLVEAAMGETSRFDRFAALEPPAFPGGGALRSPLHVLGMLWYALRDRL